QDVYDRLHARLQLHEEDHEPSRSVAQLSPNGPSKPLRVFVSYSHSTPEHADWVKDLGTFLRSNGIDARMDIWHLRRGMDLAQFMTNELALADKVILVS